MYLINFALGAALAGAAGALWASIYSFSPHLVGLSRIETKAQTSELKLIVHIILRRQKPNLRSGESHKFPILCGLDPDLLFSQVDLV